jgi:Zn finger protein HypA/HybF involved in hydrogenase expression
VSEIVILDPEHADDFEPARIVCWRCKEAFVVTRGEIIVLCPTCMAVNRGYGQ